jgi:hypothetical protein
MRKLASLVFLLAAAPAWAVTPTFVQSFAGSDNASSASYATYVLNGPNSTQAGNALVCAGQYGVNASITVSVSDNQSNSWTVNKNGTTGDTNQTVWIASAFNVAAGTSRITVTYTGANATFNQATCIEIANVTATDGSSCAMATTGAPSAGSVTPTVTGDMVVMYTEQDSSATPSTSLAVGSQSNITWNLLGPFRGNPSGSNTTQELMQYGVYNSTAALNPTASVAPATNQWNSCALFLKAGTSGSVAPSFYLNCDQHVNAVSIGTSTTWQVACPANDNLLLFAHICPSTHATAISDSHSNSWVQIGTDVSNGGSGTLQFWYAKNATVTPDMTVTTTESASATDCDFRFYGFQGAATSPLDTTIGTGGLASATGTQSVNANLTTVSVTPGAQNEIIVSLLGVNNPQIRGASTAFQANVVYSPQEASIGELDENNGAGVYLNGSSLSSFTFTYTTQSSAGVGAWAAIAAGFKAPAGSSAGAGVNKQRKLESLDQ